MKTFQYLTAKPIVAVFIFVLASSTLFAQDQSGIKTTWGGIGYFQSGYSFFDQGQLNTLLGAAGMPEVQNGALSFGGGGHAIIHNFIIGGEGHGLASNTAVSSRYRISQSGGYGFFNVGYLLWQRSSALVYPLLGIGGGGYSISITDRLNTPTDFSQVLSEPKQESVLNKGGFMLNLSLAADFFVTGGSGDNSRGGFLLGLRAGYLVEFNKDAWYLGEQQLAGGPEAGLSGPFIRLTLGGGGIARQ